MSATEDSFHATPDAVHKLQLLISKVVKNGGSIVHDELWREEDSKQCHGVHSPPFGPIPSDSWPPDVSSELVLVSDALRLDSSDSIPLRNPELQKARFARPAAPFFDITACGGRVIVSVCPASTRQGVILSSFQALDSSDAYIQCGERPDLASD